LLREEMGERAFWSGLRLFTQRHFGKSVVTTDFITAMEEAHGKSLKEFFSKWVYLALSGQYRNAVASGRRSIMTDDTAI
jgi:aminopeptidase N